MDGGMEIVDAHMHLWTPATHPWLESVRNGGHPAGKFAAIMTYTLEDYLNDIKGFNVTHAVHVEAVWPGDPVGETKWLDDIAAHSSTQMPQAIVGQCDLSRDDVEDVLKRHCSQSSRMKGIRHLINHHPTMPIYSEVDHNHFLSSPQWLRGLSLLEKHHLSFELHILPGQMMEAVEAVRQNPGVQFILNHCGLPYERDEHTMRVWREGVMALAQHQNVFCKVSGLFSTNPQWTDKAVAEIVNPLLEIFGVDRCVFASNFPVDKINGTFQQQMDVILSIVKTYSQEQLHKFFASNAKSFYRLE
eukprot:Em0022g142a